MKILLILAASVLSASLVVPTVSQGQSAGDNLRPLTALVHQSVAPVRDA